MFKIVVAEQISAPAMQRLRAVAEVAELESCDPSSLSAAVADCDALVVRSYAEVSKPVIHGKNLGRAQRLVSR